MHGTDDISDIALHCMAWLTYDAVIMHWYPKKVSKKKFPRNVPRKCKKNIKKKVKYMAIILHCIAWLECICNAPM